MKDVNFQISLPVTVLREGEAFVAYTPALDLSTSGETLEEVQKNFTDAVQLFIEECTAMGTLDDVLTDLGWQKKEQHWVPPLTVAHEMQSVQVPFYA